jgi:hypothetical protein
MPPKKNVAARVENVLRSMKPLTAVTMADLYESCKGLEDDRPAIRAALYRKIANTPVSRSRPPKAFFGIRLDITPDDDSDESIVLSLPGIPVMRLSYDGKDSTRVSQIKARAVKRYGEETVKYWLQSAQRRSVDIARTGMKKAKARSEGECPVCARIGEGAANSLGIAGKRQRITACHVVSRMAAFWLAIEKVLDSEIDLFTDKGTLEVKAILKNDMYHSDPDFIIGLCSDHDKLLRKCLGDAAS